MAMPDAGATPGHGRLDLDGRLVEATGLVADLQQAAGQALGQRLAVPQLAALARSAMALGMVMERTVLAADEQGDLDLSVRVEPDAAGCALTVSRAVRRRVAPPRLTLVASEGERRQPVATDRFTMDRAMRIATMPLPVGERLGIDAAASLGVPLTRFFELVPGDDGALPMVELIGGASAAARQPLRRRGDGQAFTIALALGDDGAIMALVEPEEAMVAASADAAPPAAPPAPAEEPIDESLDVAFQGQLENIVHSARRILDRDDGPLRAGYAQYATDIAAAGEHLKSVVRGLYKRGVQAGTGGLLLEAVERAVHLLAEEARLRTIRVAVNPIDDAIVAADTSAVVQILVNLLGNAIRYSPRGSEVRVTLVRVEGWLGVEVADDGPGIAPDDQRRVFGRYERGNENEEGSGLGLAVSRRLARSLGGDIDLVSTPGAGAIFTLLLPAVD